MDRGAVCGSALDRQVLVLDDRLAETDGETFDLGAREPVDLLVEERNHERFLRDDLLDLARITTGKLRLDLRPVDLALVIERAVDVVRLHTGDPSIYGAIGEQMEKMKKVGEPFWKCSGKLA